MVLPMQRHVSCLAGHHGASHVHLHLVFLVAGVDRLLLVYLWLVRIS